MSVKVVSFPPGCVTLALLLIPLKAFFFLPAFMEEGTAVGCGVFSSVGVAFQLSIQREAILILLSPMQRSRLFCYKFISRLCLFFRCWFIYFFSASITEDLCWYCIEATKFTGSTRGYEREANFNGAPNAGCIYGTRDMTHMQQLVNYVRSRESKT